MKILFMDGLNNGIYRNWCLVNYEIIVFLYFVYIYMYIFRIYLFSRSMCMFVILLNFLEMIDKDFWGRGGG